MKRPGAFFVVLFLGVFALSPACSSQDEPTPGAAEASSREPGAPSVASSAQADDLEVMPDVVAKVNDTEITKAELVARAESIQRQLPAGTGQDSMDFYRRVLDDLISSELLYQSSTAKTARR